MKTSLDTTHSLPCGLLLALAIALLTGCGGGEPDTDAERGANLPVDCKTRPSDCI